MGTAIQTDRHTDVLTPTSGEVMRKRLLYDASTASTSCTRDNDANVPTHALTYFLANTSLYIKRGKVSVRMSITAGVASSVASDVTMRMTP